MEVRSFNESKGKVFLVGAGPGDPELLTVKALKVLRKAEVVFYDDLVSPRILGVCRKKAQLVYVGKRLGIHSCKQIDINTRLIEAANEYQLVVRLKGGDPSIFGRVGEEYTALLEAGINTEMIAGITTASGMAASLGMPLTHRNYAREILFLSGHKKEGANLDSFKGIDCLGKTLVVYMGLSTVGSMVRELIHSGNAKDTKIAIIQNATLKTEKVYLGELGTIEAIIEEFQVKSPAILVIGEIVQYYKEMQKLKNDFSAILQPL